MLKLLPPGAPNPCTSGLTDYCAAGLQNGIADSQVVSFRTNATTFNNNPVSPGTGASAVSLPVALVPLLPLAVYIFALTLGTWLE